MSTVDPGRSRAEGVSSDYYDDDRGYGWVLFAGTMLAIVGILNIISGIAAIDDSTFYTENARFVISNLNTWGWIILLLGAAQLLAAFGVWAKVAGVRWFGVACAACNAIAQLLFIDAYPFWSLAVFTLDILVIYGLIAHGRRALA